jgi:flagella basal body P-ring formation protein FlgA
MKRFVTCLMLCALGAFSAASAVAQSGDRQSAATMQRAIETFLRVQTAGLPGSVTYTIGGVDPRVALPACSSPEVFLPGGARLWGQTSLGVRCAGATPWSILVPVQIKVMGEYVVTARPLPQGQMLTPADFALQSGDLTQLPAGILTDAQLGLGKTLTAALGAGQPLRLDLLRSPLVVQQGQTVKLQSSGRGFQVTAEGKSLNNAVDGQIAQVRTSAGNTLSGIARAGGIVEISF